MKLLFDCITPQHFIGGAGEYIRKVFFSLLEKRERESINIEIMAIYDSSLRHFSYEELMPKTLTKFGVVPVDIKGTSLENIIYANNIDSVFIGAGQYWTKYDIENISCSVVCVFHDLCDEEYYVNHLTEYALSDDLSKYIKFKLKRLIKRTPNRLIGDKKLIGMLLKNASAKIVTVSEFSKFSLSYNYLIPDEKIRVFYSPERMANNSVNIENEQLKKLVNGGRKYFLMLSANRSKKNANKAISAFKRYIEFTGDDSVFVTLGYGYSKFSKHIALSYLSESDLVNAMKHCYALVFPSFFEGFGYPPLEAMKYGKPVLCSNVTSIPEIVGGAAIQFSPFYETDIFRAFIKLNEHNYQEYSEKAKQRYEIVREKQQRDLLELLNILVNK